MRKEVLFTVFVSILLIGLLITTIGRTINHQNDVMRHHENVIHVIQKEKDSESAIQYGEVDKVKMSEYKTKITLDNGLSFEDNGKLSQNIKPRDKVGYVKYNEYTTTEKGALEKGKERYKVKTIEK